MIPLPDLIDAQERLSIAEWMDQDWPNDDPAARDQRRRMALDLHLSITDEARPALYYRRAGWFVESPSAIHKRAWEQVRSVTDADRVVALFEKVYV